MATEENLPRLAIYAAELSDENKEATWGKLVRELKRTKTNGGKLVITIADWSVGGGAIKSGGLLSSHPGVGEPKNNF